MKAQYRLLSALITLLINSTWAQSAPPAAPTAPSRALAARYGFPEEQQALTRFDLEFPGGTPKQLIAAIQKALGRPLNAIVPDEFADMQLPALKMNSVDVQQLFTALEQASRKSEAVETGSISASGTPFKSYSISTTSYGFHPGPGSVSDDTIWYFFADRPPMPVAASSPSKTCRFYALAPYLDRDLSVDDITTAIETGWKMLGEPSPPKISFHKDTKLLIAVGEPNKLEIIDSALKALSPPQAPLPSGGGISPPPAPKSPKSGEASKATGGR